MSPKIKKRRQAVSGLKYIGPLLLTLALLIHLYLVFHFNFTQDDAYITFRYAANYRACRGEKLDDCHARTVQDREENTGDGR